MFDAGAKVTAQGALSTTSEAKAAEIRALRDRIVPPEPPARITAFSDRIETAKWGASKTRESLRALLTAEAERAEKGE
jgi:hypothetical protein